MAYIVLLALLTQLHERYPNPPPSPESAVSRHSDSGDGSESDGSMSFRKRDNGYDSRTGSDSSDSQKVPSSQRLDSMTSRWTTPSRPSSRWRFNPDITPHERLYVLDIARFSGGKIFLGASSSFPESFDPKGDVPSHARMFWVRYNLSGRRLEPIAVPGADAVVTDVFVHKGSTPVFARDGAGQWYAKGRAFTVRYAVPETYFSDRLPEEALPVPPADGRELRRLARKYVGQPSSLRDLVNRLARYFRTFRVGRLRRRGHGLVQSIMSQKRGVCRHRAMIFVAIMQAYGVKARYVYNDIHAFAEVRGTDGWHRVDLGGAPSRLPRRPKRRTAVKLLSLPGSGTRGGKIAVSLRIIGTVPPVICFSLSSHGRRIVLRGFPAPSPGKQQISLTLPASLVPGRYSLKRIPCSVAGRISMVLPLN